LFICGLFENTAIISDYSLYRLGANEQIIKERMNWKGYGRKKKSPNLKYTIPEISWRDWGNQEKPVRIVDTRAEI
jgi:hypothetical protein